MSKLSCIKTAVILSLRSNSVTELKRRLRSRGLDHQSVEDLNTPFVLVLLVRWTHQCGNVR